MHETEKRKMAIKSSHQMLAHLKDLNEELGKEGSLPINVGIGLNTGEVVVGNMGSDQRFDYSCLGDAVNLAARLEAATRHYKKDDGGIVNTLYSSYTQDQLPEELRGEEIDKIKVKGKEELVTIYKPRDKNE